MKSPPRRRTLPAALFAATAVFGPLSGGCNLVLGVDHSAEVIDYCRSTPPCSGGSCTRAPVYYTPVGGQIAAPAAAQGTRGPGVLPSDVVGMYSQRIHVVTAGCLVRLGMIISSDDSATSYELRLYARRENGTPNGYPDALIWSPENVPVTNPGSSPQEIAVGEHISLSAGDYFIAESFGKEGLSLLLDQTATVPWIETGPQPLNETRNPFPPPAETFSDHAPLVYAIVK